MPVGEGKDSVLSVPHLKVSCRCCMVLYRCRMVGAAPAVFCSARLPLGRTVLGRHSNQRVIGFVSGFYRALTCSPAGDCGVSGGSACTPGRYRRAGGEVRWGEGSDVSGWGDGADALGGVGLPASYALPAGALQRLTVGLPPSGGRPFVRRRSTPRLQRPCTDAMPSNLRRARLTPSPTHPEVDLPEVMDGEAVAVYSQKIVAAPRRR